MQIHDMYTQKKSSPENDCIPIKMYLIQKQLLAGTSYIHASNVREKHLKVAKVEKMST